MVETIGIHTTYVHRFVLQCFGPFYFSWSSDLAIMQKKLIGPNRRVSVLMITVDDFSSFLWVHPLKSKSTEGVLASLQNIVESTGRRPVMLTTDQGKEYCSHLFENYLRDIGVKHHFGKPPLKASVSENYVKIVKKKIYRYLTFHGTRRYIDVLPEIVSALNARFIAAIGLSPDAVTVEVVDALHLNHISFTLHVFRMKSMCSEDDTQKTSETKRHVRSMQLLSMFAFVW